MRPMLLLLLLGACAPGQPRVYINDLRTGEAGTGQIEYDKDLYDCRREALQPRFGAFGRYADAGVRVDEGMADLCMRARGWRRIG